MSYPKMLYRLERKVPDEDALKLAISSREVQTTIVESEEDEQSAFDAGWTDSPMDFIGEDKPKRRRAKANGEPSEEVAE